MSSEFLVLVVVASLALLGVVLNQVQARLALLEVALNEGLPPGHRVSAPTPSGRSLGASPDDVASVLGLGVHVFLSRSCHACQRLVAELDERPFDLDGLQFRFVDRPRPVVTEIAAANGAALALHQDELARSVDADPLPYTIAVGDHRLVARGVTPTRADVLALCRQAGRPSRSSP